MLEAARQAVEARDFVTAANQYVIVLRHSPANVEAHFFLGLLALRTSKQTVGIKHLARVIRSAPQDVNTIEKVVRQVEGSTSDTAKVIEKLFQANPTSTALPLVMIFRALQQRIRDVASRWFDRLVKIKPDTIEGWINLGEARAVMGDLDGALSDYSRVLEVAPDLSRGYLRSGIYIEKREN